MHEMNTLLIFKLGQISFPVLTKILCSYVPNAQIGVKQLIRSLWDEQKIF